jgi:C_GCAxxG_C_C family probable redox protein
MLDKRITALEETHASADEALIARISECARNLFLSRQLQCAEAVMVALNRGLRGGLSKAQAVSLSAPFGEALGQSGCLCGALSGAVMAAGLFLGNNRPFARRRQLRNSARQLHDAFKTVNGSTCCRVLSRKFKGDKRAHLQRCAGLTADTTEMAARLILKKRPELAATADNALVFKRESAISGAVFRLLRLFRI